MTTPMQDPTKVWIETGPVANAVLVATVLFVGMPIWAAVKWLLKH